MMNGILHGWTPDGGAVSQSRRASALGENEVVELWNLVVHAQALLRAA